MMEPLEQGAQEEKKKSEKPFCGSKQLQWIKSDIKLYPLCKKKKKY